jgi:hypothetical protein
MPNKAEKLDAVPVAETPDVLPRPDRAHLS